MTISAGSIPLTTRERFVLVFGVAFTVVVLTFSVMPLIYPSSIWSFRGLFGAVLLGAIIGILSSFYAQGVRDAGARR